MSQPISACQAVAAANGDENAFKQLADAMEYNVACGHYSIFACEHEPHCFATEEKLKAMNERLTQELAARRANRPARPIGKFDKWIFPIIKNPRLRPLTTEEFAELKIKPKEKDTHE